MRMWKNIAREEPGKTHDTRAMCPGNLRLYIAFPSEQRLQLYVHCLYSYTVFSLNKPSVVMQILDKQCCSIINI
jgi:hypothetical protein